VDSLIDAVVLGMEVNLLTQREVEREHLRSMGAGQAAR
jgi:hypothetical protein